MPNWEEIKKNLAIRAATMTPNEGLIGLGSGSTAEWFIKALAERHQKQPLNITCLATSKASESLAIKLNLPIIPFTSWQKESVDFLVDGADCIDPSGNMIKGLGGALLREKLIAYATKRYVILVDERKVKPHLQGILPVEILPNGIQHTKYRIEQLGFKGTFREVSQGKLFTTDTGNTIFDIHLSSYLDDPFKDHMHLKCLVGVVETGLFLGMHPEVLVGNT